MVRRAWSSDRMMMMLGGDCGSSTPQAPSRTANPSATGSATPASRNRIGVYCDSVIGNPAGKSFSHVLQENTDRDPHFCACSRLPCDRRLHAGALKWDAGADRHRTDRIGLLVS